MLPADAREAIVQQNRDATLLVREFLTMAGRIQQWAAELEREVEMGGVLAPERT